MDYNNTMHNVTVIMNNDIMIQSKKYCGEGLDNFHTE